MFNDAELANMTVQELRDLNERIEQAIRAAIRAKQSAKAPPVAAADAPKSIDLERERDAWLSGRR